MILWKKYEHEIAGLIDTNILSTYTMIETCIYDIIQSLLVQWLRHHVKWNMWCAMFGISCNINDNAFGIFRKVH